MTKGPHPTGLQRRLASYGDPAFSLFLRKAFIKAAGYSDDALERPIVGITNTFSDYNPCHGNVPALITAVKRGVMLAGGMPFEFPTISIAESFSNPTSMFLRNLMAIDTEEMIRAQPMDAIVLIGGCDKTVPAQLMGAASAGLPAIQLITGSMLTGSHRAERVGACTDCRRMWAKFRAGEIDAAETEALTSRLAPTQGTCMVMGTASTMACLSEALGLSLPWSGSIPATHADRIRAAEASGGRAVEMAEAGSPTPRELLTKEAFHNAMVTLQAIGGSTNGLVHLSAIAGRCGQDIQLEDFDRIGREVPVLLDLKPTGDHYMEHFHWAGGVPRLLRELKDKLHLDQMTVAGMTLGEAIDTCEDIPNQTIIRPRGKPLRSEGGMAILRGNLAPGGAVIKHGAASPDLLQHTGRAVVFEDIEDMTEHASCCQAQVATPDPVRLAVAAVADLPALVHQPVTTAAQAPVSEVRAPHAAHDYDGGNFLEQSPLAWGRHNVGRGCLGQQCCRSETQPPDQHRRRRLHAVDRDYSVFSASDGYCGRAGH